MTKSTDIYLTIYRHADNPAPRCHVCRRGAGVVTALRDDAGRMADMLARAAQRSQSTDH